MSELMKRKNKVAEAKIEEKDQRWHTRNRVTLVFGSNDIERLNTYLYDDSKKVMFQEIDFHQAKSKAIEEILDNCIDEYYRGNVSHIKIHLSEDKKTVTIEDNGIGFPVDKIADVYTKFRTGSKFRDEDVDEKGFLFRTLGQNGLGAAATCLTSDLFRVTVKHHNSKKMKTVTFLDGALKIKEEKPKKLVGHSGVKVEVTLSNEVYKNNIIDSNLLRKRILDLSFNNPGLMFSFNNEKFISKKGLSELGELINKESCQILGENKYVIEVTTEKGKKAKAKFDISITLTYDSSNYDKEKFISFVNSTPTYDGGFHHDRVRRIFTNYVKEKLEKLAKKDKIEIIDSDILSGMCFIIGIVMPNPRFESQTKRKLVKDSNLEKVLEQVISDNIDKFLRKNSDYLNQCLERANARFKFEIFKDSSKLNKKATRVKIDKLLDANEKKDRSNCTLFICEGDSAIGGLRSARDKLYQGGIALKGKPMNVLQAGLKDVLANQEFQNIMGAIGLTLGQKVNFDELRFSNIVLLADSDVDGGHINTLLINFFFKFWPELFDKGCIQIAKAPLFEIVSTNNKKLFVESLEFLEKMKNDKKIVIKEIQRNKGLGEMSKDAWDYLLKKNEYTKIKVKTKKDADETIEICFGKDAQSRKDLLLAE